MDEEMVDWSQLPKDLLEQIFKHLETSTDLLRFRAVCATWRSSVSPKRHRTNTILPNYGITNASLGFSLSKRTVLLLNSSNKQNPFAWLVKIEENSPQRKRLLNPLSRYKLNSMPFDMPRVLDMRNFRIYELGFEYVLSYVNYRLNMVSDASNLYMEKVVVIWLGFDEKDYVLLTIHISGKLAMFKSGSKRWVITKDMPSPYDDVIVYKGRFFAVDNTGRSVVVGLDMELELVAEPVFGGDKKYLVESEGELLLVDMYLSIDTDDGGSGFEEAFLEHLAQFMSERTVRFEVFKLDEGEKCWIPMRSLGDRMLFLGDDTTFSASASAFSECKGNCIFFVDNGFNSMELSTGEEDGVLADCNVGVFELETGCMGPLGNYPEYSKIFWPSPSWLTTTSSEVQTQNQVGESSQQ